MRLNMRSFGVSKYIIMILVLNWLVVTVVVIAVWIAHGSV